MYKVLLVDDERIILEGIACVVEWEKHGTRLLGKAVDGKEALSIIEKEKPDIIITDIRMPGMNGIELIRTVKEQHPDMLFIILSGHEEFSSAQTAMKFGIRHYLLKPCNENEIMKVLDEAVAELKEREQKEVFMANTRESLFRLLPQIKEQFLKECITNKTYGQKEWDYYNGLLKLDMNSRSVRLLLFEIEGGSFEFEHLFALHNIAEEMVMNVGRTVLLNTTLGNRLVLLVEDGTLEGWISVLTSIRKAFGAYFKLDMTVAVSSPSSIQHIRKLYNETLECLSHRFYLGEGSIITSEDISRVDVALREDVILDMDSLALAVRSGNMGQVRASIEDAFIKLKASNMDMGMFKSYVLEMYLILIRQNGGELSRSHITVLDSLDQEEEKLLQAAAEVTMRNYESKMQSQCRIVEEVRKYVSEHLADETLSLTKLAQEIFYLNVDYLGKLFRKETGDKFSNYVMRMRMEGAKRLIEQAEHVRIMDIAAQVGFRTNPQYFSQVFKKYAGCTPSEYKYKKVSDF